ncbi:MAG: NAD(P)/FAD-dependent oxidoreductase [Acidobacteriota bacterium]|nr:NAD(P)/FAD-dependent oxidoreductase [Acidobacteriota bacterium]
MSSKDSREQTSVALKLALVGAGAAAVCAGWKLWRRARLERLNRNLPRGQKILIVGAGFAGTNAARELAKLLPRPEHAEITLVDEDDYQLFTPMLTEAAGGEIEPRHAVSPLRDLPSRIRFEQGRVVEIDLAKKQVTVENSANGGGVDKAAGTGENRRTLAADHLVIAVGSVPNFHDVPGVAENSLTVKSLGDAAAIRDHVLEMLERADAESRADERRDALTFVVGGGGFTGVETMAAVNDLVRASVVRYPNVGLQDVRALLVAPEERLLPELSAELASYAQRQLEARGVEVRLKTKITGAAEGRVELQGGERVNTRTLIWAGGVRPSPLVERLDCRHGDHGGIVVDQCFRVPGRAGVWALGDCAEIPKGDSKQTYSPTAQNATREGRLVARNIVATMRGDVPRPFRYRPVGELALVGRRAGVARVYGINFSGLFAWLLWRAVYWAKMPSAGQRARVLFDWLLDFTFGRPVASLPAPPPVKPLRAA